MLLCLHFAMEHAGGIGMSDLRTAAVALVRTYSVHVFKLGIGGRLAENIGHFDGGGR